MRIHCCFSLDFCAIVVVTFFDGVVAVAVGVVGHVSQQRVVRVRVLGAQAVSVCRRVRAASPSELAWKTTQWLQFFTSRNVLGAANRRPVNWLARIRTHDGGLPATAVQGTPIIAQAGEASEREGATGW